MDTSKEYILMCERAVEIQSIWVPKFTDVVYLHYEQMPDYISNRPTENEAAIIKTLNNSKASIELIVDRNHCGKVAWWEREEMSWLPRQDQLQEMIQPISCGELIQRFWLWFRMWEMKCTNIEYSRASMEQLWLAFVMEKKFGKTWNGEDWIKENN